MNIYYIHGFNSGKNSSSYLKLKEEVKDISLLSYDSSEDFSNILNGFLHEIKTRDNLFIGTSLGGFYAKILSEIYNSPAILINPAINPRRTLLKFKGMNKNFSSGKEYNLSEKVINSYPVEIFSNFGYQLTVCLGLEDTLIDPKVSKAFWTDKAKIREFREGHEFKDFKWISEEIDFLRNNVTI